MMKGADKCTYVVKITPGLPNITQWKNKLEEEKLNAEYTFSKF